MDFPLVWDNRLPLIPDAKSKQSLKGLEGLDGPEADSHLPFYGLADQGHIRTNAPHAYHLLIPGPVKLPYLYLVLAPIATLNSKVVIRVALCMVPVGVLL